jgi:hypothetical protein
MIIVEARKRLGEKSYHILIDNCQHFATECRYGISRSKEVEDTVKAAAVVAGVTAVTAGAAYGVYRLLKRVTSDRNVNNANNTSNVKLEKEKL